MNTEPSIVVKLTSGKEVELTNSELGELLMILRRNEYQYQQPYQWPSWGPIPVACGNGGTSGACWKLGAATY